MTNGTAPLTVGFTAHVTGGAAPYAFDWLWGVGGYGDDYDSNNSSTTASFTYDGVGLYVAVLNVTDSQGARFSGAVATIVALNASSHLYVELQGSPTEGYVPLNVTFVVTAYGCLPECNDSLILVGPNNTTPIELVSGLEVASGVDVVEDATLTSAGIWTAEAVASNPNGSSYSVSQEVEASQYTPPPPPLNVTVTTNVTNGTAPLTVGFTANITGGVAPYSSWWLWDGASCNSSYVSNNSTIRASCTYDIPGVYGVILNVTAANGARFSGNVATIVVLNASNHLFVELQENPTEGYVPLNVSFGVTAYGCLPECNDSLWLYSPNNTTPSVRESWTGAGSGESIGWNLTLLTAGTWTVEATATNPNGSSYSVSREVFAWPYVPPPPAFSINITGGPFTGSAPLAVSFDANITGGAAPFEAVWEFGDGGNATGIAVQHTYTAPGTYQARVFVSEAGGGNRNASVIVDVQPGGSSGPALVASLIASPTTGIAPLTVYFLVSATGGTSPYSMILCGAAGSCPVDQSDWPGDSENLSVSYSSAGNYTATLLVTDAAGAQSVASELVTVNAYVPLNLSATDSVRAGTSPLEVELEASIRGGVAPYTIQWAFGDGTFGSSYDSTVITHVYATPGRYVPEVTVRDATGREVVETLAPVDVSGPGSASLSSTIGSGGVGALALLVGGGLVGAVAMYAIGRGVEQRRLKREGEELVAELRAGDPPA